MSTSGATRATTMSVFGTMTVAIVGGGVLALPTGLAALGPLGALIVIFVGGLLNMVTIHALAWCVSASTTVVAGRGSLGVLTNEHLGSRVASLTTGMASLKSFSSLVVYGVGISVTLGGIAGSPLVWTVVVFAVVTVVIALGARQAFVSSAIAVGASNLVLLVVMVILVAVHARADLWGGPGSGVTGEGAEVLELVVGTVLFTFFGHLALFTVAPTALRRDPTGRSLRLGAVTAMGAATLVNGAWTVACLMTVPPERFLAATGTGLDLLIEVAGTPLKIVSGIFVVAAMGFALTNAAFQVGDVIDERLPVLRRRSTVLGPGSLLELIDASTFASVTMTISGRGEDAVLVVRGRRGRRDERVTITAETWDGREFLAALGVHRRGARLTVYLEGVTAAGIVVTVETTLPVSESHPRVSALGWSDEGDDGFAAAAIAEVVRNPAPLPSVAQALASRRSMGLDQARERLDELIDARRIRVSSDGVARAVLGSRHRAKSALVASLYAELAGESSTAVQAPRASAHELLMAGRWRTLAVAAPGPVAALTAGTLIAADIGFGTLVSLGAMATIIYLGGALPVLLALSLRRRRERLIAPSGVVATPVLAGGLFAVFALLCVVYAGVIFQGVPSRLLAAAVLIVLVWALWRARTDGAFAPRSVMILEVNDAMWGVTSLDQGRQVRHEITADSDRGSLQVQVPEGLIPPVVVAALDGGGVPAMLGDYRIVIGGTDVAAGHLDTTAGDVITWDPELHGPFVFHAEVRAGAVSVPSPN